MDKLEFLLGEWNLEYKIPKSPFSEAGRDVGTGTFKTVLMASMFFSTIQQKRAEKHMLFLLGMKKQKCIDIGGSKTREVS